EGEVALRRGLHTVGTVPEVHEVEVVDEDLALAELLLEVDRQHRLARLGGEVAFAADAERVLDELLGDGRATLGDGTRVDVLEQGPRRTAPVDAVVLVELPVLDGDDGVDQDL